MMDSNKLSLAEKVFKNAERFVTEDTTRTHRPHLTAARSRSRSLYAVSSAVLSAYRPICHSGVRMWMCSESVPQVIQAHTAGLVVE